MVPNEYQKKKVSQAAQWDLFFVQRFRVVLWNKWYLTNQGTYSNKFRTIIFGTVPRYNFKVIKSFEYFCHFSSYFRISSICSRLFCVMHHIPYPSAYLYDYNVMFPNRINLFFVSIKYSLVFERKTMYTLRWCVFLFFFRRNFLEARFV